jgi:hypothetical protein
LGSKIVLTSLVLCVSFPPLFVPIYLYCSIPMLSFYGILREWSTTCSCCLPHLASIPR